MLFERARRSALIKRAGRSRTGLENAEKRLNPAAEPGAFNVRRPGAKMLVSTEEAARAVGRNDCIFAMSLKTVDQCRGPSMGRVCSGRARIVERAVTLRRCKKFRIRLCFMQHVALYKWVIEDRAPRRGTGRLHKSCCLLRAGRARMSRRRLVRSTAQKCTVFHHQAQ